MNAAGRAKHITWEFGGIVPRSVSALASSADWNALSPRGIRQLVEVMLDELTLTGMTLIGPTPELRRPLSACEPAAEELSTLGVAGAHAEPEPLRVSVIQRKRVGRLAYERLTFEHEPAFPDSLAAAGLGGPATATVHVCRHRDEPRPWLVWVHGAGQGRPSDLLVSRARRL